MVNLGKRQIANLMKLMADIRNPIVNSREYLDLGEIDGVNFFQELQPKADSPSIIKTGHTYRFDMAKKTTARAWWICANCYSDLVAVAGEVKRFTNQNVACIPCLFCKKSEGEYNIIITDSKIQMQIINKWAEETNG